MEFNNYGSHFCVFEKIFENFEVNTVLEFGLGEYSTRFFASHCQAVTSVEQNSKEWYEKIKREVESPKSQFVFEPDPAVVFEQFDANNQKPDLVFSDGSDLTRHTVANLAMKRDIRFVVLHDVEKIWYYCWNLLNIPSNYRRFDFRSREGAGKVTTILANQSADILEKWVVPDHDRILQIYSSPTQPVIQLNYVNLMEQISKYGGDVDKLVSDAATVNIGF